MLVYPPIFDGHNDTLLHIWPQQATDVPARDFLAHNTHGHLDLPRARAGGFRGGLFAVYIASDPAKPMDFGTQTITDDGGYVMPLPPILDLAYAQRTALGMTAALFRLEQRSAGQVEVVRSANRLTALLESTDPTAPIAAVLHFEGAEAIDPHLDALDVYYRAGLRSLGIVWSRANVFAEGVPFAFPHSPDTGPGLTDAGHALVRACNELGIMIDLSHINEKGFWDVAKLSTAPLVASHSNVHTLCPVSRNLIDRQFDAVRDSQGVVGLNFAVPFLRADGGRDPNIALDLMVQHIDYMVDRMGIDCVALGSDFDGATIATEIGDVSGLPKLIDTLAAHGYDDSSLRKIAYQNWLRVLRATWGESDA